MIKSPIGKQPKPRGLCLRVVDFPAGSDSAAPWACCCACVISRKQHREPPIACSQDGCRALRAKKCEVKVKGCNKKGHHLCSSSRLPSLRNIQHTVLHLQNLEDWSQVMNEIDEPKDKKQNAHKKHLRFQAFFAHHQFSRFFQAFHSNQKVWPRHSCPRCVLQLSWFTGLARVLMGSPLVGFWKIYSITLGKELKGSGLVR